MGVKRNMPAKQVIADYWNPLLIEMGLETDYQISVNIQCFTCGRYGPRLERAHITPKCSGGSDSVENLHILCSGCHSESECIDGDSYWTWYKEKIHSFSDNLNSKMKAINEYLQSLTPEEIEELKKLTGQQLIETRPKLYALYSII